MPQVQHSEAETTDKPAAAAKPARRSRRKSVVETVAESVVAEAAEAAPAEAPAEAPVAPLAVTAEPMAADLTSAPKAERLVTAEVPKDKRAAAPKASTPEPERAAPAKPEAAAPTTAPVAAEPEAPPLPARIAENIERIEMLSQRLVRALAQRPVHSPAVEAPGPELYAAAAASWVRLAAEQPARMIEQQVRFWGETLRHLAEAQAAFGRGFGAPSEPGEDARDRRFANPLWRTNPFFHFIKTQYRINAEAMRQAAADLPVEDEVQRRRIDWFTRQLIDMMAPTNFLATNPDALERAMETEGESLVRGLENLVRDIEGHHGEIVVSLCDTSAFQVGGNIATTPGGVVHRTPLFELIQYTPTTPQVRAIPVIVFPPWINKFYIMDLKPQNSLLRWIVDQGFTLFVVSWKNPTEEHANVGMDDYISAYLEAMDVVRARTGQAQVNAVGYCIAGTTLALTLALLKQKGDDRVRSATFFTTLTDFADQGEFTAYLQDDFVGGIREEVGQVGYLSTQLMQRTFSFLRANDLVWGPAIRSYMLGETPPAFDLLYWNGDGTNLPARMVVEYLAELCQKNAFAGEGYEVLGHRLRLSDVTVPVCAVACESDHIAPWLHSYRGVAQMGSTDKTFILSESGHIAGVINPPSKDKYGHYAASGQMPADAAAWKAAAAHEKVSWWPRWKGWLDGFAGEMVPARAVKEALSPAPGTYVLEKA